MPSQLFNYFRSSASFRVRIALHLKKISFQNEEINLIQQEQQSEHYKHINSQGFVPTFKLDDKIISQSLAIIEYLDETHPNPPLLPQDPYQKSLVRAFAYTIAADIHPLNNLRVLKYLSNELKCSDEEKNRWYQHWIAKGFESLEQKIQATAGLYCFGNTITLADICLVPQMYNARRHHCELAAYPTLMRIDEECQKLPAFIEARPTEVTA